MRNPDQKAAGDIDNYDMAILAALSDNAELTTIELSKLVHLSRTAVSRRITSLRDRGVLTPARYDVHYEKLGFAIRAFVSISAPDVDSFEVLDRLLEKPEVLNVSVVLGDELLVVEIVAVDTAHLHQFLTWVQDTGHSETKVILKKHRSPIDFKTRMKMVENVLANPDPRLVSAGE
ncbi:MAG: Lrp/AsnC family transcriptional regulator [Pseudomonadota bacterium]